MPSQTITILVRARGKRVPTSSNSSNLGGPDMIFWVSLNAKLRIVKHLDPCPWHLEQLLSKY